MIEKAETLQFVTCSAIAANLRKKKRAYAQKISGRLFFFRASNSLVYRCHEKFINRTSKNSTCLCSLIDQKMLFFEITEVFFIYIFIISIPLSSNPNFLFIYYFFSSCPTRTVVQTWNKRNHPCSNQLSKTQSTNLWLLCHLLALP